MSKKANNSTAATTSSAPTESLRAIQIIKIGGMILAPGKEFSTNKEKATELIAAGVAVPAIPSF